MSGDLPEIGGIIPVGVVTKLKGTGQRIERALDLGERVVLLVETTVSDAFQLKDTKEGPKLHQSLKVEDLFVLAPADAKEQLRKYRSEIREKPDRVGTQPLGVVDHTAQPLMVDGSGNVMTPSEIAAARGEDWSADGDLFCVVFEGGARHLWPDDWDGSGQSLAAPGGFMSLPGSKKRSVTGKVLQFTSIDDGTVIAEWTSEQEDARLRAEEAAAEQAERDEARADREVVDELEAARMVANTSILAKSVKEIRVAVAESTDRRWVGRLLEAEENGKERKGVISVLVARYDELEDEVES